MVKEHKSEEAKPHSDNPEVRHETSDVNVRGLLWIALGMIATAAVIHLAIWGVFAAFKAREDRVSAGANPLAVADSRRPLEERIEGIHPEPTLERLQPLDSQYPYAQPGRTIMKYSWNQRPGDLAAGKQADLQKTAWVDPKQQIVRLPIDAAMRALTENNLLPAPSAKTGVVPRGYAFDLPSKSNSGRGPSR